MVECRPVKSKVAGSNPVTSAMISGSSSVWSEYVIWDHGVAGSNPVYPTIKGDLLYANGVSNLCEMQ